MWNFLFDRFQKNINKQAQDFDWCRTRSVALRETPKFCAMFFSFLK